MTISQLKSLNYLVCIFQIECLVIKEEHICDTVGMDEENLDVEEMDVEYINKEYSDDGDDGEDIEEDHIIGIVDLTEDVEENVFIEKDDAEDKESLHIIDLGNLDEDVEEIEDEQDTEEQL